MSFFSALFGKADTTSLSTAIKEGAFLVDVRSTTEFAGGSVKGATNIPLETIANQLEKFQHKKDIIVFCRSGTRSSRAKSILNNKGFKNVINGGGWQNVAKAING